MGYKQVISIQRVFPLLFSLIFLLCGCEDNRQITEIALPAPVASPTSAVALPSPSPAIRKGIGETPYVFFINVGKADAALVRTKEYSFLIDTGTAQSLPLLLGTLEILGIERLDGVFLTHTHKDHIGGLIGVSEYLTIEQAYMPEFSLVKEGKDNPIVTAAQENAVPLTVLKAGDMLEAGDGAYFEILAPTDYNEDDDNDNSLVMRFAYQDTSVLFTGDMQFAEEQTLIDAGTELRADVLKVGNHGNPDASGDDFINKVSPLLAVISTDTKEDTDSANIRVIEALRPAKTVLTQDFPVGVGVELRGNGSFSLFSTERPEPSLSLSVVTDTKTQTAHITNEGNVTADISGCMLLSERGGEVFRFPEGSYINEGESCTVGAKGGHSEYFFADESSPWSKKKEDRALLYDESGNLLCASN